MRPFIFMKKIALICLIINSCVCSYSKYPVFSTANHAPDIFHRVDPIFVGPDSSASARVYSMRCNQRKK